MTRNEREHRNGLRYAKSHKARKSVPARAWPNSCNRPAAQVFALTEPFDMQPRFLCACTLSVLSLCSAPALRAQESAAAVPDPPATTAQPPSDAPVPQLDPKLVVATKTPGCSVDAERLIAQLRLETRQNARHEPELDLDWYRGPLAASYMGPPAGFAVAALALDKESIVMPVLAGLLGLALPPIVHAANNNSAGAWYSVLGVVGSVAAGALLGVAVADIAPGSDARDPDPDLRRDARRDARKQNAVLFGFVSYAIWTVIDVAFFANVEKSKVMHIGSYRSQ